MVTKVRVEEERRVLERSMTVLEIAHRVHEALNEKSLSAAGITLNQALVLSEIETTQGRATVSELSQTLGRAVHTLTSAVNGLERKSLVMRHSIKGEDRRIVRIATTQAGEQALKDFRVAIQDVLAVVAASPFDQEPTEVIKQSVDAMLRLLMS